MKIILNPIIREKTIIFGNLLGADLYYGVVYNE